MPDSDLPRGDALFVQAWLYASGDLPQPEAATFEHRLGGDQAAREALCEAVQFSAMLNGQRPALPQRTYREHVRQRLRPRRGFGQGLLQRRSYRGHPALWSALGAAAAMLLMLSVGRTPWTEAVPTEPSAATSSAQPLGPAPGSGEPRATGPGDTHPDIAPRVVPPRPPGQRRSALRADLTPGAPPARIPTPPAYRSPLSTSE